MEVKKKKKKRKEIAAFVRTLLTKPISPPSYYSLVTAIKPLVARKKNSSSFFTFYRFLRKCFFAGDSCLYVTAALAIDTDASAVGPY